MPPLESSLKDTAAESIDWSTVVEDGRGWIGRLVAVRTGGGEPLDDVLQEVQVAIARSSARPTRIEQVAPWLCKIVLRQCALVVRSRVRRERKLAGFRESRDTGLASAGDPIFWLLDEERRQIVREELAALDEPSRRLLVWKYVQGLPYEEIGSRIGGTKHVAEYRVIEARKRLRRRLEARGLEGDDP